MPGDISERRRFRLPTGFMIHTLAVLVLAAELTGTVATLLGPDLQRGSGETRRALSCRALVYSPWPAPDLLRSEASAPGLTEASADGRQAATDLSAERRDCS